MQQQGDESVLADPESSFPAAVPHEGVSGTTSADQDKERMKWLEAELERKDAEIAEMRPAYQAERSGMVVSLSAHTALIDEAEHLEREVQSFKANNKKLGAIVLQQNREIKSLDRRNSDLLNTNIDATSTIDDLLKHIEALKFEYWYSRR